MEWPLIVVALHQLLPFVVLTWTLFAIRETTFRLLGENVFLVVFIGLLSSVIQNIVFGARVISDNLVNLIDKLRAKSKFVGWTSSTFFVLVN